MAAVPDLGELLRTGDPAAVVCELPDDGIVVTYAELDARTGRAANALLAAGVQRGDRVAVQVEKSLTGVVAYLACVRIGAVLLPMNPGYSAPETEHILDDAEPALWLRDPARPEASSVTSLTVGADGSGTFAELVGQQDAEREAVAAAPEELAAILYTSGTTGRPKGAMLSRGNLAANAVAATATWRFTAGDCLLHALPLFHAHGLFITLNCTLASGGRVILLPRFDADTVIEHLPRASVFSGVPTYYTRLLDDPRLSPELCAGTRLFISGSAPLLASAHQEFEARTGQRIVERYGMTETNCLTSNPVDGPRKAGTVGPALPGVEVRIAAPEDDGTGAVEVRGPSVFSGYWRRPELTATEYTPDGFFRTGDVGRIDADGYLELAGRSKDLIITGGFNVYPIEVELVLDGLDGVAESAVVAAPDPDLGEAVVAFVVASGPPVDPDALRTAARALLAGYKCPKRIIAVDALPRNALGKVEKARLRAQLAP